MKSLKNLFLLSYLTILCHFAFYSCSDGEYTIKTSGLIVSLSADGEIKSLTVKGKKFEKPVSAFTTIDGCRQEGPTIIAKTNDGGFRFEKTLVHDAFKKSCVLIDKFTPASTGIRWKLIVQGSGEPWGSLIQTRIQYPVDKNTLFWTTWGAPQYDPSSIDESMAKRLKVYDVGSRSRPGKDSWADPLIAVPFSDVTYFFGSPSFDCEEEKDEMGFVPLDRNVFCIPMATVIEPEYGVGLTFALSPEDEIIDLTMNTSEQGDIVFNRLFNRISSDHDCLFAMDITAHSDDWRPALAWVSHRYSEYFNPVNPQAHLLGGTGAYSNHYADFNVEKMKKMCFTVNWQASFDFPYIGMFLPPVDPDKPWKRCFHGDSITINGMNDYAAKIKEMGFYVLNYFNVTEFGVNINYPATAMKSENEKDLWKNCIDYLYTNLSESILPRPDSCVSKPEYLGAIPPEPWISWEGCIVMDCGDEVYRDFLLDQARRYLKEIPDASGICIDRLDWLRLFNERADDGITWFEGKPVRSLITSWKQLMEELGPIIHDAGKFLMLNNHYKRIDLLNHVDGIFDEFTYAGAPLNFTAFLCVNKPALGWTDRAKTVLNEGGDTFFQKYLYLGVFPMCPFPENDHCIHPDEEVDRIYLDYGPLMKLMQSRQWVLEAHAVAVENNLAKANIFKIPDGYSVPVIYGEDDKVRVKITNIGGLNKQSVCAAYHPGKDTPVHLELNKNSDGWFLDVPLERGCAMVKIII